jgi:hypothetical protein
MSIKQLSRQLSSFRRYLGTGRHHHMLSDRVNSHVTICLALLRRNIQLLSYTYDSLNLIQHIYSVLHFFKI